MNIQWNGDAVREKLMMELAQRMGKATVYLQGEVRKEINRGNATGKDPSRPGEPPKKVTGRLQRSIATEVKVTPTEVIGIVGTVVKYARRLEYGFVGRDAMGRNIHQLPRPFLRPVLVKFGQKAMSYVTGSAA